MKYSISILYLFFVLNLIAQDTSPSFVTIEFQYGLNENATTLDEIAQPFLDKGLAKNVGLNFSYLYETKKGRLWEFSAASGKIDYSFNLPNLIYEFNYTYNEDCCVSFPSYLYLNLGANYLLQLINREKIRTLIGIGVGLNIDISTTDGGFTINNRRYWSYFENKRGPAIFPNIDLSGRFIYNISDNFMITSNLAFIYAPFYDLDLTYFINSRDGMYEGLFHQKLLGATLSLGVGFSF